MAIDLQTAQQSVKPMAAVDEQKLIESNVEAYLERHQNKELLRFVTVGSVDDGKSTLIGRLLHDTHGIYEDQLSAVKKASKRTGEDIDFSFFTDGLKAEREQGITIDVAYRYFSTEKRKFIIADTPGHTQYTRNMATGASTAHVAVILIDARLGVLQQSRRHAYIASLLGIPHLIVCVNKMDLEAYSQARFDEISAEFKTFTAQLRFSEVSFVPISAKLGENVAHPSTQMPWYGGPTLLLLLETLPLDRDLNLSDFRYPVQCVLRPNLNYRGFAASIASGVVKKGDPILVLPSRKLTKVAGIDTFEGEIEAAHAPRSVTLRLAEEIDISRGDMLVHPDNAPKMATRFDAMLVWMSEKPLDRQKSYLLKHTTQLVRAEVRSVQHTIDLEHTLEQKPAAHLELNDIGRVTVSCHKPLFYDAYIKNRSTGAFILIDSLTNNTVAAGMILDAEPPPLSKAEKESLGAEQPHSQISQAERAERLGQKGATIWLTGLPGSGKSAVAYALERRLFDQGRFALVIDPEDGQSLSARPDGGSPLQAPELARRATDAGILVIFAFATPLRSDRAALRATVGPERFVEVHVATPREVCETRDRRGAYDPTHPAPEYEVPAEPDIRVSAENQDPEEAAYEIVRVLEKRGLLPSLYAL